MSNNTTHSVVVIINKFTDEYHIHFVLDTFDEAKSFACGIREAWKIDHGPHNVWMPLVLDEPLDFQTWNTIGCPGKDCIDSDDGVILTKK